MGPVVSVLTVSHSLTWAVDDNMLLTVKYTTMKCFKNRNFKTEAMNYFLTLINIECNHYRTLQKLRSLSLSVSISNLGYTFTFSG